MASEAWHCLLGPAGLSSFRKTFGKIRILLLSAYACIPCSAVLTSIFGAERVSPASTLDMSLPFHQEEQTLLQSIMPHTSGQLKLLRFLVVLPWNVKQQSPLFRIQSPPPPHGQSHIFCPHETIGLFISHMECLRVTWPLSPVCRTLCPDAPQHHSPLHAGGTCFHCSLTHQYIWEPDRDLKEQTCIGIRRLQYP